MIEESSTIKFLNVDLDIESREPVNEIIEEFGEEVQLLYQHEDAKRYCASFELSYSTGDAETIISSFCNLIYNLSDTARKQWDACVIRDFDVGYESGETAQSYRSALQHETIQDIAEVGGSVVITIYPLNKASKPAAQTDPPA